MPKKSSSNPSKSNPEETPKVEEKRPSLKPQKMGSEIDEIFAAKKRKTNDDEENPAKRAKNKAANERRKERKKKMSDGFTERKREAVDIHSRPRKKTNDGFTVYSEDELGIGKADAGARQKKAVKTFPRPMAGKLRPVVHGRTLKYNMKLRAGKGFSPEELKAAGIPKKLAPGIGIAVDHCRKNRSLEGLQSNVQRLKTYKAKLVIFPRRTGKFKAGDSAPEELATATQVQGSFMPIVREKPSVELVKVTDEMKLFKAYAKLRLERTNKRHLGARLKKAAEAEKEERK